MNLKHKARFFYLSLFLLIFASGTKSLAQQREFYEIKEYRISSPEQEARLDDFLDNAYLPALHRAGVEKVGVFKPVADAENAGEVVFVFIPFSDMQQFVDLPSTLEADDAYQQSGRDVLGAAHDNPAYDRITSTLLQAFKFMPRMSAPSYSSAPDERIYELRSYESATGKLYRKKVEMFNEGGEIKIFDDLDFNPVFFAEVISGDSMPNLMYMTTFANMDSRNERWDAFRAAPAWEKLSAQEYYANTVSHADIYLLHPTRYSDI